MKRIYFYLRDRYESSDKLILRRILFIGAGIAATLWFLLRVIPKPSRAGYPCMQAAAPTMSAFVIYLLSLTGGIKAWRSIKQGFRLNKLLPASIGCFVLIASAVAFVFNSEITTYAQDIKSAEVKMMLPTGATAGTGKGINPGRVVWAHAPGTATWDDDGFWFEDKYNNQANCDWLIRSTLLSLTNQRDEKRAWDALFKYYNKNNGRGERGYTKGEKISIKVNQNNTASYKDNGDLNTSPHLLLSLLKSLINEGRIPQEDITVADPSRFMTDAVFDKCKAAFPRVVFVDNVGVEGRVKATYQDNAIPYSADNGQLATGLARVFTDVDYNINMALLKGHVGQGVTLCAKNWYGATSIHSDWRKNAHNNFNQNRDGTPKYMTFVDYMGHKDLGGKCILYLIDGLYGSDRVGGKPSGKWQISPFNGQWPCSLFASQDPVAVDAVALDFLMTEFPKMSDINYADAYLVEAASIPDTPSKAIYDPERDNEPLRNSLGVVEHWNNSSDKKYSRNFGKNEGIELIQVTK